jgi:cell division protein FtsA
MSNKEYLVVAIDIGTAKIVTTIGERNENGKVEILGLSEVASKGIRRGIVLNIEDVVNIIKKSIEDLKVSTGNHISNVYVGINAQYINKPIDTFNIQVDNNSQIVANLKDSIKNINTCITKAGLIPNTMVIGLLASSDAVLTSFEKENGVALIDIGKGTTDIAIYHNDIIKHMAVIPFGGDLITKDIKEELSISQDQAELLKINYGNAFKALIKEDSVVSISEINKFEPKEISIKKLSQIIQWRILDILDSVISEIKNSGYSDKLDSGIILTGGGSLLKHLPELVKFKTGIDVKIGFPSQHVTTDSIPKVNHPKYSTSVGLLLKGFEHMENTFQ